MSCYSDDTTSAHMSLSTRALQGVSTHCRRYAEVDIILEGARGHGPPALKVSDGPRQAWAVTT